MLIKRTIMSITVDAQLNSSKGINATTYEPLQPLITSVARDGATSISTGFIPTCGNIISTHRPTPCLSWCAFFKGNLIGLSKERPILGDHPKAHIHEIRRISCEIKRHSLPPALHKTEEFLLSYLIYKVFRWIS